jgi:hypothetical protein
MSRVFISYAREDAAVANKLYQDLRNIGANPWLDTEDLLPGQRWANAIKHVIRQSSHFIVLISKNSISKRGFVQKEVNAALNVLDEIPPDEIYVIPVRLDESSPSHEKLNELHWINLFPSYDTAFEKIKNALAFSSEASPSATRDKANEGAQRDAKRMREYRQLFDRPAFREPCIFEAATIEVDDAINSISAAMSAGAVYSRDKTLLMRITPTGEFEAEPYKSGLAEIRNCLTSIRRANAELMSHLALSENIKTRQSPTGFFHHMEFFLCELIAQGVSRQFVQKAFELMDRVDAERNNILRILNKLLETAGLEPLPYITLSSEQLVRSKEIEDEIGPYQWHLFYLREHRTLGSFLKGETLGDNQS